MFRQLLASNGGGNKKTTTTKKKEKLERKQIKKQAEEARKHKKSKEASESVHGKTKSEKVSKQLNVENDNKSAILKRQSRSSSSNGSSSGYLSQTNHQNNTGFQAYGDSHQIATSSPPQTLARQNGSTSYHFEPLQHQSSHMIDARSLNHAARCHLHQRAPSMVPMVIDDEDAEEAVEGDEMVAINYANDNDADDDLDVRQMLASHRQRRRVAQSGNNSLEDHQHQQHNQHLHFIQQRRLIDGLRDDRADSLLFADNKLSRQAYSLGHVQRHANSDGIDEDDEDEDEEEDEEGGFNATTTQQHYTSFNQGPPVFGQHHRANHFYSNNQQQQRVAHTLDERLNHLHHAQVDKNQGDSASLYIQRQEQQAPIYYQPNLHATQNHLHNQRHHQNFSGARKLKSSFEAPNYLQSSSFLYQPSGNYATPNIFATTTSHAKRQHKHLNYKPLPTPPVRALQRFQAGGGTFASAANVKLDRVNQGNALTMMQSSNSRQHLTTSPEQHHHHQHSASSSPHARRNHSRGAGGGVSNQLGSSSQLSIAKQNLRSVPLNSSAIARTTPTPTHTNQNGPSGGGGGGGGQIMPPILAGSEQQSPSPMGCCGKLAKFLLFVANALFWSAGIALGAWGILALVDDHKYNLSQLLVFEPSSRMSLFQLLAWSFITLGCATILVGFCGCSALVKNSRWILGLYIFLILAIFALDLATGLLAIIFQERLVANVRLRLVNKLRNDYGVQASFTAAIDYIQTRYECCGLEGHFDYDQSLWRLQRLGGFEATVARTCCHLRNTLDDQAHVNPRPVNESMCQSTDVRFHQSYRYRRGCLDDLERLIRNKIWTFTIGCGAVGAIILLSLIFATCFCRSIKPSSRKSSAATATGNRVYHQQQAYLGEPPSMKKTTKHSSYSCAMSHGLWARNVTVRPQVGGGRADLMASMTPTKPLKEKRL